MALGTWTAQGEISYSGALAGPTSDVRVELYDRDPFGDDFLGSSTTDTAGRFEIAFDPAHAGRLDRPDLRLLVVDYPAASRGARRPMDRRQILATFDGASDLDAPRYDFGSLTVSSLANTAGPFTSLTVGRILHDDGGTSPLHGFRVELYDRDVLGDDFLGAAVTDAQGNFSIAYDAALAGRRDEPDLRLLVVDYPWETERARSPRKRRRVVGAFDGGSNVNAARFDFGTRRVEFWEYAQGPLARVVSSKSVFDLNLPADVDLILDALQAWLRVDQEDKPQRYSDGYSREFARVGTRFSIIRLPHQIALAISPTALTVPQIQADYPKNLTIRAEDNAPGSSRTDAFFVERVVNGFNPCLPRKIAGRPDAFRVVYDWNNYTHDGAHELPNVDLVLKITGNVIEAESITVQVRQPASTAPGGPMLPAATYTPADGAQWEHAKRIYRCNNVTAGELDVHLGRGHLNAEQYAVAAFRNLRHNPVRNLLSAHLKDVASTNDRGSRIIFGDEGIVTTNSSLTGASSDGRLVEQLGSLDWFGWSPRPPFNAAHTFAHAANLYWTLLTTHVDRFFQDNDQAIRDHWFEIKRMSDDLVAHAVEYRLLDGLPPDAWYSDNEIADPNAPRQTVGGIVRAVSPITDSNVPTPDGIANLKQMCRYAIYHASFFHSWSHNRQTEDGGEVLYASLGLRNGAFGDEADFNVAPTAKDATVQLFLGNALVAVDYGYVIKNEDGDVPQALINLLEARRGDFNQIGINPDEIRSCTNT